MIQETAHASLRAWESFYIIVGSSAAALTGLQFVVVTLIADTRSRTSGGTLDAFATPTIVHFCAALLVAVTVCAPWPGLAGPDLMIGATGVLGLVYTAIVVMRARRQTNYEPVLEDWIWHGGLPVLAYGTLAVGALTLAGRPLVALFGVAASTLLLVYIGIHNAWDTTTFVASGAAQSTGPDGGAPDHD